jgi:hypothetical protein
MRQPFRFIQMLADTAPEVVVFTHYYDEALIRGNPLVTDLFGGPSRCRPEGSRAESPVTTTSLPRWASPGSCGGSALHSYWMHRADIIDAFRHFGYRVETSHEEPQHPNGPGFALLACKA